MLTKLELETVSSIIEVTLKCWFLPFTWNPNPKSYCLFVADSKCRTLLIYFLLIGNVFYLFILIFQIPVTLKHGSPDDILYHAIYVVSAVGTVTLNYILWSHRFGVTQLVNQMIHFNFSRGWLNLKYYYFSPLHVTYFLFSDKF